MKIFECSDSFMPIIDGVGRVVKAYAETLAKRDNEVYVITPTDDTGYRGGLAYEIIDFTSLKLRDLPYKLGIEDLDSHFKERIKMIKPDIVHVHSPGTTGLVGKALAKKNHVPLVGSFHSKYYDDVLKVTHSKVLAKISSTYVANFYNQCDEVWAVSENAAETLKSYGYKGKILIMPNGTNRRVLNESLIDPVAKQYGIDRSRNVLLFVGQINWKKNIKRILESCSILKKEGVDFQLVLAGQGPDYKDVVKTAKQLNLSDNLIMTGHVTNAEVLDCLYSLADLFVFPSIYDNAPMVLREAACMRTPGLVISGSSSAEVVKHMENGLVCKDTNEDVAKSIKDFIALPKNVKDRIGENACDTIPVPWDGELMDNIEEEYNKLINNKKKFFNF